MPGQIFAEVGDANLMSTKSDLNRRNFLKQFTATGATLAGAPAVMAQAGTNEKVGLAVIGVGTRGFYLMQKFQAIDGVELRTVCDLYDGNLKRAREHANNDRLRTTREWEKVVADPDIDAIVIATPDFWHAPMTIGAAS